MSDSSPQRRNDPAASWRELFAGKVKAVCIQGPIDKREPARQGALFPGAFHPLHRGHHQMYAFAKRCLKCEVAWELSVENVDKPPLDDVEIERRVAQFPDHQLVWLTRAPTFVDKSEIFPGTTFVVGADTLMRISDPRYYGVDRSAREAALARIASRQCRFLVFGRLVEGRFLTLSDLSLPEPLAALCQGVGPDEFQENISSTELRQGH